MLSSYEEVDTRDFRVRKIVIDAGHGGKDPGTSGSYSREKDVALNIAKKFGGYVEELIPDVEVIYTRNSDHFVELVERSNIANKNGADLFVSIHCNSLPRSTSKDRKESIFGTETYVMGLKYTARNLEVAMRENSVIEMEENYEETYGNLDPNSPENRIIYSLYQAAFQENSLKLATRVEEQFAGRAGRRSRGVKQSILWVLNATAMPSILIETGYLSNSKEERELNDPQQQDYIASGIFRAFRDYKEEIDSMN